MASRAPTPTATLRVIVMTGAGGRAFCAGADLSMFKDNIKARETNSQTGERRERGGSLPALMRNLSKPSIAAINGYAPGVGSTLTLLFDVRIASENAKMGVIFPHVGLMIELGSSYLMPKLIGLSKTAEMMLTGRQYTAQQCLDMGLVGQVVPAAELKQTTQALVADMLQCSPFSLMMTRRALYQGLDGNLENAMSFEMSALEKCYTSPEHKEYVTAFLEKRKPDFMKLKK
jgi:enoyl-CoA hydratase/carnithine racemase